MWRESRLGLNRTGGIELMSEGFYKPRRATRLGQNSPGRDVTSTARRRTDRTAKTDAC